MINDAAAYACILDSLPFGFLKKGMLTLASKWVQVGQNKRYRRLVSIADAIS